MIHYGVVAHGGVGTPAEFSDGCKTACQTGLRFLEAGKSVADAVVEAARVLEDDGRFNAGRGSALRLDGRTIEMDAAVMDSLETIGIVISVRNVRNPILVARAVVDSPHVALSGQGATAFARARGFGPFHEVSEFALERYAKVKKLIEEGKLEEEYQRWKGYSVESLWNSGEVSYREAFPCDTIGVVAMDKDGNTAAACSTGGISPMMLGRVGDVPMIGCGFFAGSAGAITATGIGEEIIKRMLAKTVYDMILHGDDVTNACKKGISMFSNETGVGLIGISRTGYAVESNREMASYALIKKR